MFKKLLLKPFTEGKVQIFFRPILHIFRLISKFIPKKKNLWVFGSFGGLTFSGNPKYLYLQLQNKSDVKPVWITANKALLNKLKSQGFEAYNRVSIKGILTVLRAGFLFFDYSTHDINYWLSGGGVKVNLWHGLPLKKISRDDSNDLRNTKNPVKRLILRIYRPWTFESWDYSIATSEIFREKLSSGLGIPADKIPITGYPRNDVLFREIKGSFIGSSENLFKRLKAEKQKGRRIIAYFPTFRESGDNPLDHLNFRKLDELLSSQNAILVVKLHPYTPFKEVGEFKSAIFVRQSFDFYPLLSLLDLLITDYSSIYLDFIILGKPVIFYAYDLEEYKRRNRELYFDYEKFTPGQKVFDFDFLLKALRNYLAEGKDPFKETREKFIPLVHKYRDGNSAERVYEFFKKI